MKTTRIGSKMAQAAAVVQNNPGVRAMDLYREVGPNGSIQYGFAAVARAERAGLVERRRDGAAVRFFPRAA